MLPFLVDIHAKLDAVKPGLFNAILAALVLAILWGVKKARPEWFAKLPETLQAWPALTLAALTSALSTSTVGSLPDVLVAVLANAALGLLSAGAGAIGLHHAMKQSKLPYGNPPKDKSDGPPPSSGTGTKIAGVAFIGAACLVLAVACVRAGKFDPNVKNDVHDACTWLDSGNPLIGMLCLTAEEIVSVFSHVKASRAHPRAAAAPGQSQPPLDICAAPVEEPAK